MINLTFYANDIDGCVSCIPDDKPLNAQWFASSDTASVLDELAHIGRDTVYFRVSPDVYEDVLEIYNIY